MSVWPPPPRKIMLPRPTLMLVTEHTTKLPDIAAAAVDGGVNVVLHRCTDCSLDEYTDFAYMIRVRCQRRALVLAYWAYAMAWFTDADGLHFKDRDDRGRLSVMPDFVLGQSVHTVERAVECAERGVDYLLVGSIYETRSHPGAAPQGLDFLAAVCMAVDVPVIAIGGITPERVGECIVAGASGVAVLSPIMRADDPKAVAMRYRQALDEAWPSPPRPSATPP